MWGSPVSGPTLVAADIGVKGPTVTSTLSHGIKYDSSGFMVKAPDLKIQFGKSRPHKFLYKGLQKIEMYILACTLNLLLL